LAVGFRLPDEEKQKDFELALSLANSHPTLFQVGHEFEFDDYLEAIRDVSDQEKPESYCSKTKIRKNNIWK
jgi:hypothetical protein